MASKVRHPGRRTFGHSPGSLPATSSANRSEAGAIPDAANVENRRATIVKPVEKLTASCRPKLIAIPLVLPPARSWRSDWRHRDGQLYGRRDAAGDRIHARTRRHSTAGRASSEAANEVL